MDKKLKMAVEANMEEAKSVAGSVWSRLMDDLSEAVADGRIAPQGVYMSITAETASVVAVNHDNVEVWRTSRPIWDEQHPALAAETNRQLAIMTHNLGGKFCPQGSIPWIGMRYEEVPSLGGKQYLSWVLSKNLPAAMATRSEIPTTVFSLTEALRRAI